jgi:hypothetical protein
MDRELMSPCGIYCGRCSAYLAYVHQIPRQKGKFTYCAGCRPRNKQCSFLKRRCERLRNQTVRYCFECPEYPCASLEHLAQGYRTRYGEDFLENLALVRDQGEEALLETLRDRYACERCGGLKSIHSGKCFVCDDVKSWKD